MLVVVTVCWNLLVNQLFHLEHGRFYRLGTRMAWSPKAWTYTSQWLGPQKHELYRYLWDYKGWIFRIQSSYIDCHWKLVWIKLIFYSIELQKPWHLFNGHYRYGNIIRMIDNVLVDIHNITSHRCDAWHLAMTHHVSTMVGNHEQSLATTIKHDWIRPFQPLGFEGNNPPSTRNSLVIGEPMNHYQYLKHWTLWLLDVISDWWTMIDDSDDKWWLMVADDAKMAMANLGLMDV